ncbi:hypothetical protein FACS189447_01360 [Spirochaetia bacterium]|nr:hypothetical protein FACS189447_01360 [Spirochaetia bacterium]
MKRLFSLLVIVPGLFILPLSFAAPLYSPTWGFSMDLPEDYEFTGGDSKNSFSFTTKDNASFDLSVYAPSAGKAQYASVEALAKDVQRRLGSTGEISAFEYRHKQAVIIELTFSLKGTRPQAMTGWGFCVELPQKALLLALAYGPAGKTDIQALHLSALDSLAPEKGDSRYPGPISDYSYPRETRKLMKISGLDAEAWFYEEDAEAAQALVDREFNVLKRYASGSQWKEAWVRFYKAIYRDSYDRLADAAFIIERKMNVPSRENRDLGGQLLQWVQNFKYERDLLGSDFVNLVSACTEGRGDCDSRAMLWALIMNQADVPAGIMVSREFSHAMGLADLPGPGAHFTRDKKQWLVAETTAKVAIGLIGEKMSDIESWIGIPLD